MQLVNNIINTLSQLLPPQNNINITVSDNPIYTDCLEMVDNIAGTTVQVIEQTLFSNYLCLVQEQLIVVDKRDVEKISNESD